MQSENPEMYNGNLLFIDKVSENAEEFKTKVETIATELGINPNWLMVVMKRESGLNHKAVNTTTQATGLIQFMPKTAEALGTTVEKLKQMSNLEQLDYVKKYYEKGKPFTSLRDLYLFTFFPTARGRDENYVFRTSALSAANIAQANPGIARNKSQITMKDYDTYIQKIMNEDVPETFKLQFA